MDRCFVAAFLGVLSALLARLLSAACAPLFKPYKHLWITHPAHPRSLFNDILFLGLLGGLAATLSFFSYPAMLSAEFKLLTAVPAVGMSALAAVDFACRRRHEGLVAEVGRSMLVGGFASVTSAFTVAGFNTVSVCVTSGVVMSVLHHIWITGRLLFRKHLLKPPSVSLFDKIKTSSLHPLSMANELLTYFFGLFICFPALSALLFVRHALYGPLLCAIGGFLSVLLIRCEKKLAAGAVVVCLLAGVLVNLLIDTSAPLLVCIFILGVLAALFVRDSHGVCIAAVGCFVGCFTGFLFGFAAFVSTLVGQTIAMFGSLLLHMLERDDLIENTNHFFFVILLAESAGVVFSLFTGEFVAVLMTALVTFFVGCVIGGLTGGMTRFISGHLDGLLAGLISGMLATQWDVLYAPMVVGTSAVLGSLLPLFHYFVRRYTAENPPLWWQGF